MSIKVDHLAWLSDAKNTLTTACGKRVDVYDLIPDYNDVAVFSSWAKHFRNHYCLDEDIDTLINGTSYNRKQYLEEIKFPTGTIKPGPSIRTGDFAEILISDFVEYYLKYWVPRTRYADKNIRNESTKGSDLIGFRFSGSSPSPSDALVMYEIKAKLSGSSNHQRLQDAIDHSVKDELRKSESLNAIKQRLIYRRQDSDVGKISRFQNAAGNPYVQTYGAVAVIDERLLDANVIINATTANHPKANDLKLIIIIIKKGMDLVNHLYKVSSDEA